MVPNLRCFSLATALFLVAVSRPLLAEEPPAPSAPAPSAPAQVLSQSSRDIKEGRIEKAIAELEHLADQGIRHPDLAFNRGLAYLARAAGPTPLRGDFGQAAAAFAEAHEQRPSDAQAQRALEDTQLMAAKKRTGSDNTLAEPLGLAERVLLALDPRALFAAALLGSLSLTAGLIFWGSRRLHLQTMSWLATGIGVLTLGATAGTEFARQSLVNDHQVAVVIASRAPLLDETGRPLVGELPLLETAVVHLKKPVHGLAPLLSLGSSKWIRTSQIRVISKQHP